jgi:hypothetical protein
MKYLVKSEDKFKYTHILNIKVSSKCMDFFSIKKGYIALWNMRQMENYIPL